MLCAHKVSLVVDLVNAVVENGVGWRFEFRWSQNKYIWIFFTERLLGKTQPYVSTRALWVETLTTSPFCASNQLTINGHLPHINNVSQGLEPWLGFYVSSWGDHIQLHTGLTHSLLHSRTAGHWPHSLLVALTYSCTFDSLTLRCTRIQLADLLPHNYQSIWFNKPGHGAVKFLTIVCSCPYFSCYFPLIDTSPPLLQESHGFRDPVRMVGIFFLPRVRK